MRFLIADWETFLIVLSHPWTFSSEFNKNNKKKNSLQIYYIARRLFVIWAKQIQIGISMGSDTLFDGSQGNTRRNTAHEKLEVSKVRPRMVMNIQWNYAGSLWELWKFQLFGIILKCSPFQSTFFRSKLRMMWKVQLRAIMESVVPLGIVWCSIEHTACEVVLADAALNTLCSYAVRRPAGITCHSLSWKELGQSKLAWFFISDFLRPEESRAWRQSITVSLVKRVTIGYNDVMPAAWVSYTIVVTQLMCCSSSKSAV